jgi:hypothetical protein
MAIDSLGSEDLAPYGKALTMNLYQQSVNGKTELDNHLRSVGLESRKHDTIMMERCLKLHGVDNCH